MIWHKCITQTEKPQHTFKHMYVSSEHINEFKLWWEAHIKKTKVKMTRQTLTLLKLSTSTWGASFQNVRQIYNAVIQSAWAYESAVWYHLKETWKMKNHIIKRMTVIQNQCLRKISRAYKVTLIEVLKAEMFILLADLYLQKLIKLRAVTAITFHSHDYQIDWD